jgi:hypothetical protein
MRIKLPLEFAAAAAMVVLIIGVIGVQQKEISTQQPSRITITRSAVENKQDSNRLSRRLEKVETTSISKPIAAFRKETEIKPIVLAMFVKPGTAVPSDETPVLPQAPSKSLSGKAAGIADEEDRSVSYFSESQPASEVPAQDAVTSVAPGATLSKDYHQLEEKGRLNLEQTRQRVKNLVQMQAGNILSGKDDQSASDQRSLTVNIPADRYNEFVEQLKHIAPFQTPPPSPPEDQTLIRVEIRFISSK